MIDPIGDAEGRDALGREFDRVSRSFQDWFASDPRILPSGHACAEDEAYGRIRGWSERAGVTRLARCTDLDRIGIPNYYAVRPGAKNPSAIIASGKGVSPALAVLSALFEAFERWAAEDFEGPSFAASRRDLAR